MKTSSAGIELIKKYEGCRTEAYKCAAGVWTIGYGHTKGVKQYTKISMAQAEQFLLEDISVCENVINGLNPYYQWNQNQFDAMVSFCFNCGAANVTKLTANRMRTKATIADKMLTYCKANGKQLDGLLRRRKEERALFLTPVSAIQQNGTESAYGNFQNWIKMLQTACNEEYSKVQKVDGIPGEITLSCCPTLRTGSRGVVVGMLQQRLNEIGYSCGNVDKIFGEKTEKAVKGYQKAKAIKQDGIVGKETWRRLIGLF